MTNSRYWIEDQTYVIGGDTYNIKDDFKTVPGYKWDPARKVWILPRVEMTLAVIRKHKISQRIKVLREAFCHEPEAEIYVEENRILGAGLNEAIRGNYCSLCDSRYTGTVGIKRLEK